VNLLEKLYNYLKVEIGDKRDFIQPSYPGELLISYGLIEYSPLVLITYEDPIKVVRDAKFFFDKVYLLSEDTLNEASTAITSEDFDLMILNEKSFNLEIPIQENIRLKVGNKLPREDFIKRLEEGNLIHKSRVYEIGEYVVRGGIIDLWTANCSDPLRVELEDEKISSLRFFEPYSQLSKNKIKEINLLVGGNEFTLVKDVINKFFKIGPDLENYELNLSFKSVGNSLRFIPATSYHRDLNFFRRDIKKYNKYQLFIVVDTPGEIERLKGLFGDEFPNINYIRGFLSKGFIINDLKICILTEADIFGLLRVRREETKRRLKEVEDKVFREGDFVVHEDFGVGCFKGLQRIKIDRRMIDCLIIEYADQSRVLVPLEKSYLVTQYISGGDKKPVLSSLSKKKWERKKRKVKEDLKELANSMLSLYARRASAEGYAFSENESLQRELELSFPFVETKDQREAIREVYEDMERENPMDRLLCGEVGFGKTEVALRAAFKATSDSKQVALLAPTTVLSKQHYRTFKERLDKFPVNVELLSRFTEEREKEVKKKLECGECDIVIGTHKLLNKSINFKDLGLLIIDEEQRFGVKQKDRLKKYRVNVDVLSMTATPIPRTLQMSLLGISNLSLIESPPEGRKEVITEVIEWDEVILRDAILKEIERGGQVFFVHNRIKSIEAIKERLKKIVPEISIIVGHGQLPSKVLEKRMTEFIEGKYDILLSTAIIESGLDMPNVNTIIIDRAHTFGMADLHQLRGRVGRSIRQGYCYLVTGSHITMEAKKRIAAIKTYSELGAGFKISMRDLEIRGAGEILGAKQHGHIAIVGYELYLKMLQDAISELKGEEIVKVPEAEVSLIGSFYIPTDYIPHQEERISLYRKISSAKNREEISGLEKEIKDRFGKLPENVKRILKWARIRILSEAAGIIKVKESINEYRCDFKSTLSKDEIRNLVSEISGLRFSYDANLTVFVPRGALFPFLEKIVSL
jgi:transcription-repair coupling factor (superfamily II helicase)